MTLARRIGVKLKRTGPLFLLLRLIYRALTRCKAVCLKLKTWVDLVRLVPQFHRIYADNSQRIENYGVKNLVDELRKVSAWYPDFLGLIDFWKYDPGFKRLFSEASKAVGNYETRCFVLYQMFKQVDNLDGDIAEVGVYKGRTAKLLALMAGSLNKSVHLFDTFTGMPEVNPAKDNFYQKGAFSDTSLAEVQAFLSDCKNITIYPGFFPATAEPVRDRSFSFVHVDVDIYQSVLDCCRFFYSRLVSKGIIVFDDPGFADCAGAKIAVEEFFADKEEFPVYLATGQVLIIKR